MITRYGGSFPSSNYTKSLPTLGAVYLKAVEVYPQSTERVHIEVRLSSFKSDWQPILRYKFDDFVSKEVCKVSSAWGHVLFPGLQKQ